MHDQYVDDHLLSEDPLERRKEVYHLTPLVLAYLDLFASNTPIRHFHELEDQVLLVISETSPLSPLFVVLGLKYRTIAKKNNE